MGKVNEVEGHDGQYIELRSKHTGGKFSSGYRGGETRNVLFLTGRELDPTWLFDNHLNYIRKVTPVKKYRTDDKTSEVVAMYYEYVTVDTNKNGSLDMDDLLIIAVSNPDGTGFLVLEDSVSSVIDMTLSKDASNLVVLFQQNGQVVLNNYDPKTFDIKSSSEILEVSGAS